MFKSPDYFNIISKIYNKKVYKIAKEYSKKSNYHPFRHEYALLSIFLTKKYLSLNERLKQRIGKEKAFNYILK